MRATRLLTLKGGAVQGGGAGRGGVLSITTGIDIITPPWIEWLIDRCKDITLPQTSFAGGNYIPPGAGVRHFIRLLKCVLYHKCESSQNLSKNIMISHRGLLLIHVQYVTLDVFICLFERSVPLNNRMLSFIIARWVRIGMDE